MNIIVCELCQSNQIIEHKYIHHENKKKYLLQFFLNFIYKWTPNSLIKKLPNRIRKIILKGLWDTKLSIKLCKNCFFGHLNNIPRYKDLFLWYETEGNTTNLGKEKRISRPISQFEFIKENINLKNITSILDYGVGNQPSLVQEINKFNKEIKINVSDISHSSCQLLNKYKFIDNIFNISNPTEIKLKFDLIVLSHIINQIDDINKFFSNILSILENNGYLMIEMRNNNEDYYKYIKKHNPYFFFFNAHSFELFIKKFNLKILIKKLYGPSYKELFSGTPKHYFVNDNGVFIRYILKK